VYVCDKSSASKFNLSECVLLNVARMCLTLYVCLSENFCDRYVSVCLCMYVCVMSRVGSCDSRARYYVGVSECGRE
jgi:hypothetical protein